eukprot:TRINITY_DN4864_c0_g1_i2.p1 TRINITY_DN4864_c0_g1~~TRINITY_DN4864_c0_g1_i2.p1  ORF type:complete len:333 (-),score=53.66 TRINITY_DN4864_c0_g1_i2:718-1716(-)
MEQLTDNFGVVSDVLVENFFHFRDICSPYLLHSPGFPLLVAHCLCCTVSKRPSLQRQYWLLNLTLTVITACGGGIVLDLVHGRPFQLFSSPTVLPTAVICWYLVNYSPFDVIYKILCLPLFRHVMLAMFALKKGRAVIQVFDHVASAYPGAPFTHIVFASWAGCGGGVVASLLMKFSRGNSPYVSQFSAPDFGLRMSFFSSLVLYLTRNPDHLLVLPKFIDEVDQLNVNFLIVSYFFVAFTFRGLHSGLDRVLLAPLEYTELALYFILRVPADAEAVEEAKLRNVIKKTAPSSESAHSDPLNYNKDKPTSTVPDASNTSSLSKRKNKKKKAT